ncbi:nuclear envelope-associated protein 3 isoform X2 [Oryza sativa Japonica Group]|uniref:nuclear envelope-associated protein 3 isoform X2 n=1 Tax=Oryza sativa subsp. japonica TaxID=39947 RepID=UPI0007755829|nr:nuclear envelope-associated protein 2 isoform X2 [Oryza sativa Japonica Group]
MPISERATTTPSSSYYSLELDPLLSDLAEKKLSLRRSLAWLDAELKDAKIKLASKEQLLAQESENRKFAESRARSMEEEVKKLHKCLQDKDEQLRTSICSTEQYLSSYKLDILRSQISVAQATAEASAESAMLARLQCLSLSGGHEKINSLGECELRVKKVEEQLDLVQKFLEAKELSQLEKNQMTTVHELKKKVLKLECTLKVSRAQLRKLHKMVERRDKPLKKLQSRLPLKQQTACDKQKLWESSGFRIIASMSILALAMLSKR